MAESIDHFFDDDDFNNTEISEPAAIIHSFLTDTSAEAESTARGLLSSYQASDAFTLSMIVAQIIVSLAEERPEAHQPLLKLLGALQGLLETANPGRKPGDTISLNYELWERGLRYGDPDPGNDLRELYRQNWTNVNRFAALVHEALIEDLSIFGEHTLELTLRKSGWRVTWKHSEGNSDEIDALQGHAEAAAQWILICGRRLFNERESIREHWAQWQQDLEWITIQDKLRDETLKNCQEALAEMRSI
ncbi:unnamed protein product [Discula destructiva]